MHTFPYLPVCLLNTEASFLIFFEVDLHRDKRKNQTHNFNLVHFFLVVSDCHAKFSFRESEELGEEKNKKIPTKHKIALSEKRNI